MFTDEVMFYPRYSHSPVSVASSDVSPEVVAGGNLWKLWVTFRVMQGHVTDCIVFRHLNVEIFHTISLIWPSVLPVMLIPALSIGLIHRVIVMSLDLWFSAITDLSRIMPYRRFHHKHIVISLLNHPFFSESIKRLSKMSLFMFLLSVDAAVM